MMNAFQNLVLKGIFPRSSMLNYYNVRSPYPRYYSCKKEPSDKDICNVKQAWCEVAKNKACYGKAFFSELFKKHPDYAQFFSKYGQCPSDILSNEKFIKEHVNKNVMDSLGKFINKMDDMCVAKSMGEELGKKHIKYCVKAKHFENAEKILLSTLKTQMGDKLSCEGGKSMESVFKVVFGSIKKGLQGDKSCCN